MIASDGTDWDAAPRKSTETSSLVSASIKCEGYLKKSAQDVQSDGHRIMAQSTLYFPCLHPGFSAGRYRSSRSQW